MIKIVVITAWAKTRFSKPLSVMVLIELMVQEPPWHVNITVHQQELFTAFRSVHSPTVRPLVKSFLHILCSYILYFNILRSLHLQQN